MTLKPKVLILTDWFIPGFKAGGPIQSLKNLVDHLQRNIDFSIITGDRDLGDVERYNVQKFDIWISEMNHRTLYTTAKNRSRLIEKELTDKTYDFIYLNSFFSLEFTLKPILVCRRLRELDKIVLAPRGMLGQGALSLKPFKKKLFLAAFKLWNIHRYIGFHSTDISETSDIKSVLGNEIRLTEISNLPASLKGRLPIKLSSPMRFVFASRISPKKNLDFAIKALMAVGQNVVLDIYGVIDDLAYWEKCQSLAAGKLDFNYHGSLSHAKLMNQLTNSHFFILPTLNENFGHSIIESMSIGLPVIISDQTPWSDINAFGAGRVIALSEFDAWVDELRSCTEINDLDYNVMCQKSIDFVQQKINIDEVCMKYKVLFGAEN